MLDLIGLRIEAVYIGGLDELLPWNWAPLKAPKTATAKAERAV